MPGDDTLNQALAEFVGYFWCRFASGQVVGERIVRFLASPEEVEATKQNFGPLSIVRAKGDEQVQQLAFKALPAFHSDRNCMAVVEAALYRSGMWQIYLNHLRAQHGLPLNGSLSVEAFWSMITADARTRATAAFVTIDAQRPKQQALFG